MSTPSPVKVNGTLQVTSGIPVRPIDYPVPPTCTPPINVNNVTTQQKEDTKIDNNSKINSPMNYKLGVLEFADGSSYQGISFGAETISVSGECVFQTGMVGYPESLTDPSYEGQILVLTFPLVGNYGVPSRESSQNSDLESSLNSLPAYFESSRVHIAALIIGSYSYDYSHHLAESSLGTWLKEQNVPALYGIDTRLITKKIRESGSMLGKVLMPKVVASELRNLNARLGLVRRDSNDNTKPLVDESWKDDYKPVNWIDPNKKNLVAAVSTKKVQIYHPSPDVAIKTTNGRTLRILAVDVGMKYNQIRCFVHRGVELKVVPWDYDFVTNNDYDGLFISNGPGDPTMANVTISNIAKVMEQNQKPIFGICLGHQLLALAAGAKTMKMKYGNRGHNIPCTDMLSGRCYVTSQNHGFAVDTNSLPQDFKELYVNANDGSNEGIYHISKPFFSVQFHPESTPGPRDTEFLFDVFIATVKECQEKAQLVPIKFPGGTANENAKKAPRVHVKKVLILGSGGLSIGQAGEFDYSGSQAIKALKEEGIYTILINPNIATIQTSKGLADKVYFLPVNADFVRKVIKHEKPDGIYCTFGGQTALSVGIKLKDEFEGLGVKVLGTPIQTIITTEDRELFAQSMLQIGEKCAESASATTLDEALKAGQKIGFPVIVRAAFALGGLGSGFAQNVPQLTDLCNKAFAHSPQVLIEKSMKGWKEIEYEVVRDCRDNCITVCNMENFDPLGIHTGDSIVVAPSQTLSDEDYNMLRTTAVSVIRHLGVVGECNIQYALNPNSKEYCIIEVNARLSRSSALASKATGYPLAFIAAKLGLGIPLNEIRNSVTRQTSACFEPSLDYCVVKIPRWDLKKFSRVSTALNSSMKSVGEVMSIGRTFEETIQKAIRAIDYQFAGFGVNDYGGEDEAVIDDELVNPSDKRLFAIANAMHLGYSVEKIHKMTNIDRWFLNKLQNIMNLEKALDQYTPSNVPTSLIKQAKQYGMSDRQLAKYLGSNELAVRRLRKAAGITPFVKQIDTVAAEFPAHTNYLYVTYNASEHDVNFTDKGVMVLGSGVYRIGSSVEFDWCAVRAIRTLREKGVKTIMVNYNPETVSTDYDEADRLYFENINLERALDIYEIERSTGVIISMGGQTPNNIALPLHRQNVKILGTSPEMIDTAENRYKFSRMLDKIGVDQPAWKELTSISEAEKFCEDVSYPVLVRPSYVLSGAAMNVVFSKDDLENYLTQAAAVSREYPVVITKYIEEAKEIEMDAVAKNGQMIMHFISEHVENAGVHSGDATLILPPQDLDPETVRRIEVATQKIAYALNVTGPFNIQFIAKNNEIKVIECNIRASRSFPFVSKVMDVDLIEMATKAMFGVSVEPYPKISIPENYVGVKVPQFSFSRLSGADPVLGVEMASTGEVACFGRNKYEAYLKGLLATGIHLPKKNILLSIGSYKEKLEMLPSVKKLHQLGYNLFATAGTADFFQEHGVPCKFLETLTQDDEDQQKSEYSLRSHLANNLIDMYINLPSKNRYRRPASYMSKGYRTRRLAVDYSIPLITNVKIAKILIEALARNISLDVSNVDYKTSYRTVTLPGLINIQAFIPSLGEEDSRDFTAVTKASLGSGFTTIQVMPVGIKDSLEDLKSVSAAQQHALGKSHCDFTLSVAATADNADRLGSVVNNTKSLFIPFNHLSNANINKIAAVASHFGAWDDEVPIVTDAKTTDLASILLLASLHNRSVHITNVTSKEDINLIALSKGKGLKVTCDVAVYSLFLTSDEIPNVTCLPSKDDQKALWDNLKTIDCFSVGSLPYQVSHEGRKIESAVSGIEETIPLLLSAVHEGRLTLEDVTSRLYERPKEIFDIPDQPDTYVEVELDRRFVVEEKAYWSPFVSKSLFGSIHRVVLRGQTVYLDGAFFSTGILGKDISGASSTHVVIKKTGSISYPNEPRPIFTPILPTAKTSVISSSEIIPLNNALIPFSTQPKSPEVFLGKPMTLPPPSISSLIEASPFYRRHILSVKQFSREDLHHLFSIAHEMRTQVERNGSCELLRGRVLCTMFYEPSTRTSASFETAMNRLGGKVVSVTSPMSSVQKGESLADTVRTLGCYADAIVMRHPAAGSAREAATYSPVPVINAGDGVGEHPTQAFLDIYTMREELGTVNGLTITLVGDLKNGRTVHSLVRLLSLYQVTLNYVAPPLLSMPEDVQEEISKRGIAQYSHTILSDDLLARTDVLYVTRVQKERFLSDAEYEAVKESYVINNSTLGKAKPHMIVMHPLPRVNEIDPEVDFDQRAAYFRQMRYGLFVRMALLATVMGDRQS